MDSSKFLGKFKDATEDHLQRMNAILLTLEQDPRRPDQVAELMREIHTLKGESRMMGFGDMADIAHAVEDVLRVQQDEGFRTLERVSDQLFEAFDLVERLLAAKLGDEAPDVDVAARCEELRRAGGAGSAGTEAPAPEVVETEAVESESGDATGGGGEAAAPGPERAGGGGGAERGAEPDEGSFGDLDLGDLDLPEAADHAPPAGAPAGGGDSEEAVREAFGVAGGGAEPETPRAPAVQVGGGVSKFLGKFKDATDDHLQRMNAILLELEQDADRPDEVKELMREIHTLKGESRMMGFGDMADVAHAIEDLLKAQQDRGFADLAAVSDLIFEGFDAEERLLAEKLGGEAAGIDVASLAARLREAAEGRAEPAAPRSPEAPDASREEAPDRAGAPPAPAAPPPRSTPPSSASSATAKFMGKFADATRDHLERMNAIVLQLESDPDRPDEVKELMREIHTLKGESRMMGFGDMADVAHAVEDLLKAQQDEGFARMAELSDLVFEAFDAETALLDEKLGQGGADVDAARIAERCRAAAAGQEPSPPAEEQRPAARPEEPESASARAEPPASALEPIDPLLAEGFRAAAAEHAGTLEGLLDRLAGADASARRAFDRALEALRTEAHLSGFTAVADLASAIERCLAQGGDAPSRARLEAVRAALDAVAPAVSARCEGSDPAPGLRDVLEDLRSGGRREEPAPPAPPADAPRARDASARADRGKAAAAPEGERRPPAGVGATSAGERRAGPAGPTRDAQRRSAAPTGGTAPAERPSSPSPSPSGGAAAAAGSAPKRAAAVASPPRIEQTIRIGLGKLTELGNLTGDIYLSHTRAEERQRRIRQLLDVVGRELRASQQVRATITSDGTSSIAGGGALHDAFESLVEAQRELRQELRDMLRGDRDEYLRVGHLIIDLRERVRSLQMLPVSTLFDMYPRMVRDIAKELGKRVRLAVEGGDTELDRRVLDEIRDPMVHLIRNAVDHGIEEPEVRERAGKPAQGRVTLSARSEGDHVVIEIEDDGGGIDPQRIRASALKKGVISEVESESLTDEQAMQLIFAAGFSSKDQVSDISGRGVGLDVVREKVESLDGRIAVWSEPGQGTRMALRLPLTLAMARVLLIRAGGLLLAVPCSAVADVLKIREEQVRRVESYEAIEWHGRTIPIVSLAGILERESHSSEEAKRTVVVLGFEDHLVGFVVDQLEGEREVVIKRLDAFLGRVRNVAGATILSSGEIVVVLHVPQLIASTMGVSPLVLRAVRRGPSAEAAEPSRRKRLLVVDDSIIVRDMMKGVLEAADFDVTLAVDGMDGLEKQLAERFDLVITDVEMPRMDGFELTRSIKQNEEHGQVPVIIVTTLDSAESKAKGLQAGASAYIVKNLLDMSQLVETIERLVR